MSLWLRPRDTTKVGLSNQKYIDKIHSLDDRLTQRILKGFSLPIYNLPATCLFKPRNSTAAVYADWTPCSRAPSIEALQP